MKPAIVTGILLSALLATDAHAQADRRDSTDVRLHNDCRLGEQILTTGHPHPRWNWALDTIDRCAENGGEALATVWASPPADTTGLARLVSVSSRLRGVRVLDAALETAGSESADRLARLSALQVAASYGHPGAWPGLEDFEPVT